MEKIASEIHAVCHGKANVQDETKTHFTSGFWRINERNLKAGLIFALHESKDSPSYLQGEFESFSKNKNGKMIIRVRKNQSSLPWAGGGTGVLGYRYPSESKTNEDQGNNSSPIYFEGACNQITTNRYERDLDARKACIAVHGTACFICGFDFGKVYGKLGTGFIHIHHLEQISSGNVRSTDPARDLVPVCPNCHSMLHKETPPIAPQKLRKLLSKRS